MHEIKVGAARSFGARHRGKILFLAALVRVAPGLLALGAVCVLAWLALNTGDFAPDVALALGILGAVGVLAAVAWHYLRWTVLQYIPIPSPVAAGLGVLVLIAAGTLTMWAVVR